ncbi:hypothetical protein Tco_0465824 [Tanacetum coccineum]
MFIEQSHDEVYGCLKGGSGNSGGKRLAISMVEEAWLSEKKEVSLIRGYLSVVVRSVLYLKVIHRLFVGDDSLWNSEEEVCY